MRRDRIANEKIIMFYAPAARTDGTHTSGVWDLRRGPSGEGPGRELPTNCMFIFTWGTTKGNTTAAITVSTGDTATTTSFATIATFAKTSANLVLAEIRDLQRYISLSVVLSGNATFAMVGSFNRSRREPVLQEGIEVSVTYNKNPATA